MTKTVLRNLLFTIAIGMSTLLIPKAARAVDAQCANNTNQAYLACLDVCNNPACNNCANPSACQYNWPITSPCTGGYHLDLCNDGPTCAMACAVNRDSDLTDCHFGC
jgi:hypothetical protein